MIGNYVTFYSNSMVIGSSIIGDNVILSANCYIKGEVIPSNSIVYGMSPYLKIVKKDRDYIIGRTRHIWKR